MNVKDRIVESEVRMIVDSETGEVISENMELKTEKIVTDSPEGFFMVYTSIVGVLSKLTGSEVKLLQYWGNQVRYNENVIWVNASTVREAEVATGIAANTIYKCASVLVKKNMLIRIQTGAYRINPKYYWKGGQAERRKMYKYVLEIECPDC